MAVSSASAQRCEHQGEGRGDAPRSDPIASPSPIREADGPSGIGITQGFAPGQVVVVEGDPIEHYFRILSGTVRLYKAIADGRRQVIDFLGQGECFGLTGLARHGATVEAVSRCTVVRYSRHHLEAAIHRDPGLACRLFELACAELGQAQRQMLLLGRKTAEERIASFLLSLAERGSAAADGCAALRFAMSRQDMADYLGLTIETVSRIISRFKRDGLIALQSPQAVVLLRPETLRMLAEGGAQAG